MAVSLKTHKMLWGRAGSRCAICKLELVEDSTETDDESIIGEACHIVARKEDGARGVSLLTKEQRDKYNNLILLCNIHHKIIDDQENEYTVEKLLGIKNDHVNWVKASLELYDVQKQRDDEIYSTYIEEWEKRVSLNEWSNWTSWLLSYGYPQIFIAVFDDLENIGKWILSRVWPKRYKDLELALNNFAVINQDFVKLFSTHKVKRPDLYAYHQYYRDTDDFDYKKSDILASKYEAEISLLQDLILELTRAANLICTQVRSSFYQSYRLEEGIVLIDTGPSEASMNIKTHKIEYRDTVSSELPYPGLNDFKNIRFTRDLYFGRPEDNDLL